jgi:hypothetical protein
MPQVRALRINRFTVMAMLQAARARYLGLSEDSAYSWGLNRAIFYAAAKKGFSGASGGIAGKGEGGGQARPGEYRLGQDLAYRDPTNPKLLFTIGGEVQTAEDFRAKIASRFGGQRNFRKAWEEATSIVSAADEDFLKSGEMFYSQVYKPRRDDLVEKWAAEFTPPPE